MSTERPKYSIEEEMFFRASMKCSASVVCQAACIAADCIEKSLNPLEFLNSLKTNPNIIPNIISAATRAHVNLPIEKAPLVSEKSVSSIWYYDFELAHVLTGLGAEELKYISDTLYKKYFTEGIDSAEAEQSLQRPVIGLMINKGMLRQARDMAHLYLTARLKDLTRELK